MADTALNGQTSFTITPAGDSQAGNHDFTAEVEGEIKLPETTFSVRVEDSESDVALRWLDKFLPIATNVAIFGGSITFSVIPSELKGRPEKNALFSDTQARQLLAIAWLLFLVALGTASITLWLLEFWRKEVRPVMDGTGKIRFRRNSEDLSETNKIGRLTAQARWMAQLYFKALPISALIQLEITGAFLCMSLVVVDFCKPVGLVGVVLSGFAAVVSIIIGISSYFAR